MSKDRVVWQGALSAQELYEFKKVVKYRGTSMSYTFRLWIRTAFRALPEEAK